MRKVRGRWGFDEVTERGVTANCNMKAGMDVEKFCKYVEDCIVPLYPDAADKPGKRVLLIVDSGPGRTQVEMLARLRTKDIYVLNRECQILLISHSQPIKTMVCLN